MFGKRVSELYFEEDFSKIKYSNTKKILLDVTEKTLKQLKDLKESDKEWQD